MDNDTATEANELQVHPLKEEQDMLLRKILALPRLKSAKWSEVWGLLLLEVLMYKPSEVDCRLLPGE